MIKTFFKRIISVLCISLAMSVLSFADTTPMKMTFELVLATQQGGALNDEYDVILRIGTYDEDTDVFSASFEQAYSYVLFQDGFASFVLGNDNVLNASVFDDENVVVQVEVDSKTVEFPIPSVPYALQANTAEFVDTIYASNIKGAFTQPLLVQDDLHVYNDDDETALYVDSASSNVGVGTDSPAYTLDINGSVNADEYLIDGEALESVFSWSRNGNNINYTDGYVGIGTTEPEYHLDVVGTVNASEFYRQHQTLNEYLQSISNWKDSSDENDIYFEGGSVGIGVTEGINERLVVSGAVRIGASVQPNPVAGTIEYNSAYDDFLGYVSDGSFVSLTGVQVTGNVSENYIAYWEDDKFITGTSNLVFVDGKLGIGTSNPTALLSIQGDGISDYISITDSEGNTTFKVNTSGNIGVGKASPNYALSVDGIIDATEFYVDGVSLQKSFSSGSFWSLGNTQESGTDLFYDQGNVGIGTQSPSNLLELASSEGDVGMTFDIGGTDLFTIGIAGDDAETFLISQGGDLTNPIFTFTDSALGFGTNSPNASLHVSGNAGLLVEGAFDDDYQPLNISGTQNAMISAFFYLPAKSVLRAGRVSGTHWDAENLGDYSVAFGYNNKAVGEHAVIAGGYNNVASGNYAFIAGGYENKAEGDYSFAAGRFAEALHDGSFVWSDATVSTNAFSTTQKNQFLIRSFGGVGINTNETEGTALAVKYDSDTGNILELEGIDDKKVIVDTEGRMGIGTTDLSEAGLSVEGKVGVGTTEPSAVFEVRGEGSGDFIFYAASTSVDDPEVEDPYFVITSSGNVGIGTSAPVSKFEVNGKVYANSFVTVDPDNPNAYVTLQPFAGSPWADPSTTDSGVDTYRLEGFVGIGTSAPATLLELSNQNDLGSMPIITFDLDGNNQYQMGLITNNGEVFFVMASTENFSVTGSHFSLSDTSLVLGRGAVTSNASLDVSGNVVFDGKLAVATTNFDFIYDALIDGSIHVNTMNIAGKDFELSSIRPWETVGTDIYTSYNVGIQTDSPTTELEVVGTVSANSMVISDEFTLNGDLLTAKLHLEDAVSDNVYGALFVDDGTLFYEYEDRLVEISSPLSYSVTGNSGPLAFWVDSSSIGVAPIYWDSDDSTLSLTSNFVVSNYFSNENGLQVTTNLAFKDDVALSVESILDHYGLVTVVTDYTVQDINLAIREDWGNAAEPVSVRGLNIDMNSEGTIVNNSTVVGMYVDVSSVNIDVDQSASKYAAVFLGGNVGIGLTNPTVELEVDGIISANYFNLSQGLSIARLTVDEDNYTLFAETNAVGESRVGIGTSEPSAELDVYGTISANILDISGGLTSTTMNIANSSFVVDDNGHIGIGTDSPSASFQIVEEFSSQLTAPHTSEKIDVTIKGDADEGYVFYFSQDITGMKLAVDTGDNTFVKDNTLTGLNIDFSTFNVQDNSTVYGMYVDVSSMNVSGASSDDSTRYAAIFDGGNVGIGISEPEAALHVSGSIKADNLVLEGGLETETLTVNNLVVNETASLNAVTVNELVVVGSIVAESIVISDGLTGKDVEFDTVSANNASVGALTVSTLNVTDTVSAAKGYFSGGLAVGTTNIPVSGLRVSGNIDTDSLNTDGAIYADSLNVGEGALYVDSDGNIGIGTTKPDTFFHISSEGSSGFNIDNTQTWNALKLSLSEDANTAASVGLLFAPSHIATTNLGSGIVAQRETDTASNLVFITDPKTAGPSERMRITHRGDVGVGTTEPEALFHVAGEAYFEGAVTINDTLTVSVISSNETLTVRASDGIVFDSLVSFEKGVSINSSLALAATSFSDLPDSDEAQLYIDDSDYDLYLLKPDGASINITNAFTGEAKKIPFYGESGGLDDTADLLWDYDTNQLKIGTANSYTQLSIESTFTDEQSSASVQHIEVAFGNRTDVTAPLEFVALGIDMSSYPLLSEETSSTFGRLGDGETAVGLHVDMRDLVRVDSDGLIENEAHKYAALFQGGYVGIGTETPDAWLHVQADEDANNYAAQSIFKVEGDSLALVVSNNGYVGLGEAQPEARLHVSASSDTETIVLVSANSSAGQTLQVVDSGVLIGPKTASITDGVLLDVRGRIDAEEAYISTVSTNELVVGDYLKITTTSISIGTLNNSVGDADLYVYKNVDSSSSDVVGEKVEIVIDGDSGSNQNSSSSFVYESDIVGIGLDFNTAENNSYAATLTGVSVNVADVSVNSGTLYGFHVRVGEGDNRYAAIFEGGNVGIGVTDPSYELEVSGSVKADNLILSDEAILTVGSVSAESINVSGSMSVVTLTVHETLNADVVSANEVKITGPVEFDTLNANQITVNEGINVADGGFVNIGLDSLSSDYVFGVSGNAFVSGNLFSETIFASLISANTDTSITFNSPVTVLGDVSANLLKSEILALSTVNSEVTAISDSGQLYISSNGRLMYLEPGGTEEVDLLWRFSGTKNRIPYFSDSSLSTDVAMEWDATTSRLNLGSASQNVGLSVVATVNESLTDALSAQSLELRLTGSSTSRTSSDGLKGLGIVLKSDTDAILGDEETAIGIQVDMRDLVRLDSNGATVQEGNKYAALFQGGYVGVGTASPEAWLHVQGDEDTNNYETDSLFKVEGSSTALVVSKNSYVGVGTASPEARLHILGSASAEDLLLVSANSNSGKVFRVSDDGVLIGDKSDSLTSGTLLDVRGKLVAESAYLSLVSTNELIVSDYLRITTQSMSIGTTNTATEDADLYVYKLVDGSTDAALGEKVEIVIDGDGGSDGNSSSSFSYESDIVGMALDFSTADNNGYAGNLTAVSVNVSSVSVNGGTVYGLYVDAGEGDDRYAAIFEGGNVGIGVTNPSYALEVSGSVKATGLILSEDALLSVGSVSAQSITVTGDMTVASVSVTDTLSVDVVSANQLILTGEVAFSELDANVITVNEGITVADGGFINLGLTALPDGYAFGISGNAYVSGNLYAESVYATTIEANTASSIAINSDVVVSGNVSANKLVTEILNLTTVNSTVSGVSGYGQLFVSDNGNLMFMAPGGTESVDLLWRYSGVNNRLPYFYDGDLKTDVAMEWDASSEILSLGSSTQNVALALNTFVDSSTSAPFSAQTISLTVSGNSDSRSSSAGLTALSIDIDSAQDAILGDDETAIGVQVDMRDLVRLDSNGLAVQEGHKYAAVFQGGYVGVGTDSPDAWLHIQADETANNYAAESLFKIDSKSGSNVNTALVVSNNAYVGFGTDSPEARLHIQGAASTDTLLLVSANASDEQVFQILNDGIVVGAKSDTLQDGALLDVNGSIVSEEAYLSTLSTNVLVVGEFLKVTTESMSIGTLNTTNENADLFVYRQVDADTTNAVGEKVEIVIDGDSGSDGNSSSTFTYESDLVGMGLDFSTADNNSFAGSLTGVSVNIANVSANSGTLYGYYIDAGEGDNRYAAIFEGANVGIGVTNPSYELEVSGTVRAKDLILSDTSLLDVGFLSVTTLNVSGEALISTLNVSSTLIADTVSANNISIAGDVQFVSVNVETITVNTGITLEDGAKLNIGLGSDFPTGYVMGVSGNVYVSGNLYTDTLRTNSLSAQTGTGITINSDVYVDAIVSASTLHTGSVGFNPTTTTVSVQTYGQLFVSKNGDLTYMDTSGTQVDLMSIYKGTKNRIPVFNAGGLFTTDAPFEWDSDKEQLSLGSSSDNGSLQVEGIITSNTNAYFAAHTVKLLFENLYDSSESVVNTITGLDINLESMNKDSTTDFGRLNTGDTVVGLRVDMSDLTKMYYTSQFNSTKVQTYPKAAVFGGGLVGVGTTQPEATLHVMKSDREEDANLDIFRLDVDDSAYTNQFVITSTGNVGFNASTSEIIAQLTIKDLGATGQDIFGVYDSTNKPKLVVDSTGVGVNTSNTTTGLTVSGKLLVGDYSTASPTNVLYVDTNKVGIGTSAPAALLSIVKPSSFTNDLMNVTISGNKNFTINNSGLVSVGTDTALYDLNVGGVILALDSSSNTQIKQSSDYTMHSGLLSAKDDAWAYFGQVSQNSSVDSALLFNDDSFVFRHVSYNSATASTFSDVLYLSKDGVGVNSNSDNDSVFYVNGSMKVELPSAISATSTDPLNGISFFNVDSSTGRVGVRTDAPRADFDVYGSLSAQEIDITASGISVSTLNISGTVDLDASLKDGVKDYSAQLISVNLNTDIDGGLYGLNIKMASDLTTNGDDDLYYHISELADAYGIYVDMTQLVASTKANSEIESASNYGYKYAAAFLGGNVGIGTDKPRAPLEVKTKDAAAIAGFGTQESELVIEDVGEAVIALNVVKGKNDLTGRSLGLTLKANGDKALVGIGTTQPDSELTVNGDMRIGVLRDSSTSLTSAASEGNKLIFSGGATASQVLNSDNGDTLYIGRANKSAGVSELRVNFSTFQKSATDTDYDSTNKRGTGDDKFVIGHTASSSFLPILSVHNNDRVGIAVNGKEFSPEAPLHVRGTPSSSDDYVTVLTNTTTDTTASILGLVFSSDSETLAKSSTDLNFVTFKIQNAVVGQIEANMDSTEAKGVKFLTRGADYAEYLEKRDHSEAIEVGDIVGVIDGKISKDTTNAQHLMVLSNSAGVAGNWQGDDADHYELVAFFGQIKTKVKGKVKKGDYILSSGQHDGVGIAVSKHRLSISDRKNIVGRAWESSSDKSVKFINTAVGFEFAAHSLKDEMEAIENLDKELENLQDERQDILDEYDELFDKQSKEIEALLSSLETE